MKLVMTILVKNEEDIIEDNIRFHAAQGVDAFYVMDNDSSDRTQDIVRSLQSELDIKLEINTGQYDQGPWMTYLAKQSKKALGADLVISNDADEFWSCNDGESLKSKLSLSDSIVTVHRYNYIQSLEAMREGEPYCNSPYRVACPVVYSRDDQLNKTALSMPLAKISPKVIVNPKGLIKIKGGNHRAKHLRSFASRDCNSIVVEHYPIRSYAQFEKNIENRRRLLDKDASTRMGVHYKRWVELLRENKLLEEFESMSLSESEIAVLEKIGVIEIQKETALSKWKKQVNG